MSDDNEENVKEDVSMTIHKGNIYWNLNYLLLSTLHTKKTNVSMHSKKIQKSLFKKK